MMKKLAVVALALGTLASCKAGSQKLEERITAAEAKLLDSADVKPIDVAAARNVISMYQEYTSRFPKDSLADNYWFKTGELYNAIGVYDSAVWAWKTVTVQYDSSSLAPKSLYWMAFVTENNLTDYGTAVELYKQFLQKYPTNQLAAAAQFSLENMSKSSLDIIREFEAKNGGADSTKKDTLQTK